MLANHAPASNDSPQGDSDYETILTALTESARGRSFLQEYLRRNRSAETESLLTAIARIEGLLKSRSLEPDQTGIDITIQTAIDTETVVAAAEASYLDRPDASQSEAAITDSDGCEAWPTPEAAQAATMAIEVPRAEIVSAEVAEIDVFSVEIVDGEASAIEFLGPQPTAPATSADHAAPPGRTDKQPRDPFADFYALSNEEKIALFA